MLVLRYFGYGGLAIVTALAVTVVYFARSTRSEINALEARVAAHAQVQATVTLDRLDDLPAPVKRYFAFTFPNGAPTGVTHVVFEMDGVFRRPLKEGFTRTTARQVAAVTKPDMVFSADTPVFQMLWAIVWDSYLDGKMEMNARIISAMTVMHEEGNETLNAISLRRWLLESSAYPMAMLPGGPVTWEAIDDTHAKVIAMAYGTRAELIATFDDQGALTAFTATTPGDLTTPYHGSGEYVSRSDFKLVDGVRVPTVFEISRVGADGVKHPFWRAKVARLQFVK